jgi:hypothetical protein
MKIREGKQLENINGKLNNESSKDVGSQCNIFSIKNCSKVFEDQQLPFSRLILRVVLVVFDSFLFQHLKKKGFNSSIFVGIPNPQEKISANTLFGPLSKIAKVPGSGVEKKKSFPSLWSVGLC